MAGKPLAPSVLLPRPGPPRLSARSVPRTSHACPSSGARPSKDVMENDLDQVHYLTGVRGFHLGIAGSSGVSHTPWAFVSGDEEGAGLRPLQ